MEYIIIALVMFYLGWKLGRKYQDFQDLMIARRVAKMVDQREQLNKEREQFEKWERQDKRYARIMGDDNDDRSFHWVTRTGKNVSHDQIGTEAHEERNTSLR